MWREEQRSPLVEEEVVEGVLLDERSPPGWLRGGEKEDVVWREERRSPLVEEEVVECCWTNGAARCCCSCCGYCVSLSPCSTATLRQDKAAGARVCWCG